MLDRDIVLLYPLVTWPGIRDDEQERLAGEVVSVIVRTRAELVRMIIP